MLLIAVTSKFERLFVPLQGIRYIETLEMLHVIIFLHVTIFSESRTSYVKLCTRKIETYTTLARVRFHWLTVLL